MLSPRLALFDVDETLIRLKSMFSFLDHLLTVQGWSATDRKLALERFSRFSESGASREEVNAAFYRGLAGFSRSWVLAQGDEWFDQKLAGGNFFHEEVLRELRLLRDSGTRIALVSGSFDACLSPLAAAVLADDLICSEPETDGDVYTGELPAPMIGEGKSRAAQALIERLGLTAAQVRAYGDHPSDVPLLRCAQEGVVVGQNAEMLRLASLAGWRHLPLSSAQPHPSNHPHSLQKESHVRAHYPGH